MLHTSAEEDDMKRVVLALYIGLTLHAASLDDCAYPALSEAEKLFSSNAINSSACLARNSDYQSFARRLSACSSMQDSASVESAVLRGAASFVVNVSTNTVDDGTPVCILYDRADLLLDCVRHFKFAPAGATNCLDVCNHLASVRPASFDDDLTRMRGGVHLFNLSTNADEIAKFNGRVRQREKNIAQRRIQLRVKNANKAVQEYRRKMLETVTMCVAGYRGTMDDCQFSEFTNQISRAVNSMPWPGVLIQPR